MRLLALDHVQLAMPAGEEARARAYFVDLLGMTERTKPASGVGAGGCWFHAGPVELHLGIDPDFSPARKAHPAFEVDDLAELTRRLTGAGFEVRPGGKLEGRERVFADDPFGNRIEWIELER
jgi:catechol 2,3-dioxygenase-like lactoylglutathione lyase family enzyme